MLACLLEDKNNIFTFYFETLKRVLILRIHQNFRDNIDSHN